MIPALSEKKEDCCGCKACANVCPRNAISFVPDQYGFEYPVIDPKKCVECGRCLQSCDFKKTKQEGIAMLDPLEGYAVQHAKEDICWKSTSGGMFTALAEWVIEKHGLVYGCVFNDEMKPIHDEADNMDKVALMRGSKYAQSDVGNIYYRVKEKLNEGKWTLFTGTPCQVAALYAYLGKTDVQKLITADVVCHGIPSPLFFKEYIDYLSKKYHKKVNQFLFRSKRYGWGHIFIEVGFEGGKSKSWFGTADPYFAPFSWRNQHMRPNCYHCKYTTGHRVSDFTFGDFWGWEKTGIGMSPSKGLGSCLINTEKAKNIFPQLHVNSIKVPVESIINGNEQLRTPSKMPDNWETTMESIAKNGFHNYAEQFRKAHTLAIINSFIKKIIWKKMCE